MLKTMLWGALLVATSLLNGDQTFARGDTRPYWTLGRKDSRALDARPVGH